MTIRLKSRQKLKLVLYPENREETDTELFFICTILFSFSFKIIRYKFQIVFERFYFTVKVKFAVAPVIETGDVSVAFKVYIL